MSEIITEIKIFKLASGEEIIGTVQSKCLSDWKQKVIHITDIFKLLTYHDQKNDYTVTRLVTCNHYEQNTSYQLIRDHIVAIIQPSYEMEMRYLELIDEEIILRIQTQEEQQWIEMSMKNRKFTSDDDARDFAEKVSNPTSKAVH